LSVFGFFFFSSSPINNTQWRKRVVGQERVVGYIFLQEYVELVLTVLDFFTMYNGEREKKRIIGHQRVVGYIFLQEHLEFVFYPHLIPLFAYSNALLLSILFSLTVFSFAFILLF